MRQVGQKVSIPRGRVRPDAHRGEQRQLRPKDFEALRRLQNRGPLTIPEAYDCGHRDTEATGHGMNRLVAARYAVFDSWDADRDDGLWVITERGREKLRALNRV